MAGWEGGRGLRCKTKDVRGRVNFEEISTEEFREGTRGKENTRRL